MTDFQQKLDLKNLLLGIIFFISAFYSSLNACVFIDSSPYCPGETISFGELDPSNIGSSWDWSGPNGFTASGSFFSISSTDSAYPGPGTHTYFVTVTYSDGSTNSCSHSIEVRLPDCFAHNGFIPNCADDDIQLFEDGGEVFAWDWSGPNGFTSTDHNPIIPTSSNMYPGAGTHNYFVTITDTNGGCSNTCFTDITIDPVPTCEASNSGPYCLGDPIELFETGVDGASWEWFSNSYNSTIRNPTMMNTDSNYPTSAGFKNFTVIVKGANPSCQSLCMTTVLLEDPPSCGTCPITRNLTDNYFSTLHMQASDNITADNTIQSTANVQYDAGIEISLTAGFEVELGAVFEAYIDGCTP